VLRRPASGELYLEAEAYQGEDEVASLTNCRVLDKPYVSKGE
jgi:hypothetical protein